MTKAPRLKMLPPLLATSYASPLRTLPTLAQQRGGGRPWRRARERALQRDCGLCVLCQAEGRTTLATEVDHIVPLEDGGAELEDSNLRSLCSPCHATVTAGQARRRFGYG